METHFCILAWEIPWTEDPGEIQSMRSQGVRHDLATNQQQHIISSSYCLGSTRVPSGSMFFLEGPKTQKKLLKPCFWFMAA